MATSSPFHRDIGIELCAIPTDLGQDELIAGRDIRYRQIELIEPGRHQARVAYLFRYVAESNCDGPLQRSGLSDDRPCRLGRIYRAKPRAEERNDFAWSPRPGSEPRVQARLAEICAVSVYRGQIFSILGIEEEKRGREVLFLHCDGVAVALRAGDLQGHGTFTHVVWRECVDLSRADVV